MSFAVIKPKKGTMRVGIPAEIKNNEYRVAITPNGVMELASRGHEVLIEAGAGVGSSITDQEFADAGARILSTAEEVWAGADLLLKVKEPIENEYSLLRSDQVLFTYLHLAASRSCTQAILDSGTTAIAYETVQRADGSLPLLTPMSEVAGRLAAQVGSFYLMRPSGGRGMLMGGATGTRRAQTVIVGGGVAGEQAARVAMGMGSNVTIIDVSLPRLKQLEDLLGDRIETRTSNQMNLSAAVADADLVIGSVLIPGAKAPKLVTNEMVASMRPGSVLVDIAVDQGGCFEGTRPTTHDEPTFKVHDSLFYCVANMPGAVPVTSTYALTNSTLPFVVALAEKGWRAAIEDDPALARGLNIAGGRIMHPRVAEAFPDLTEDV